jgi:hypothetical protein
MAAKREVSPNLAATGLTVITNIVKVEKDEEEPSGWTFHWKARGDSFTEKGHKKVNRTPNNRGKETSSSELHKVFTNSERKNREREHVKQSPVTAALN